MTVFRLKKTVFSIIPACFLVLLLSGGALCQTIKATTGDGREVTLFPDGSWEYTKKERQAPNSYRRPASAKDSVADKRGSYEMWFNGDSWQAQKENSNSAAAFEFGHKDGDVYAMVIAERLQMPIETLKNIAIENAREAAPDAKIVFEEKRTVNGAEVLCLRIDGTLQGIEFTYFGYYYAGKAGSIQVVTFTGTSLFDKYKDEMTDFLNGLVVY